MKLGLVSDTHGHILFCRAAIRMLQSCEVQTVIHCGDIGSEEIIEQFSAWPTHFVFGNVDYPEAPLRQAIEDAGQTCHERFGTLELAGRRIAILHGDDGQRLRETIACGQYDLICHGHTHVMDKRHEGSTLVVNPGALYRAQPHSLAIVELPELVVTHIPL